MADYVIQKDGDGKVTGHFYPDRTAVTTERELTSFLSQEEIVENNDSTTRQRIGSFLRALPVTFVPNLVEVD